MYVVSSGIFVDFLFSFVLQQICYPWKTPKRERAVQKRIPETESFPDTSVSFTFDSSRFPFDVPSYHADP